MVDVTEGNREIELDDLRISIASRTLEMRIFPRGCSEEEDCVRTVATITATDRLVVQVVYDAFRSSSTPDEVKLEALVAGPEAYRRLAGAGMLSVYPHAGSGLAAHVRAMRISGREWPTLAGVTWDELDTLAKCDVRTLLRDYGAAEFGPAHQILGTSGPMKNNQVLVAHDARPDVFIVLWAVTRILPIRYNLGGTGVEVLK